MLDLKDIPSITVTPAGEALAAKLVTEAELLRLKAIAHLQARGLPLPRYSVDSVSGELHAQVFRVPCEIEPMSTRATAAGSSRRRAEQAAAASVLEQIQAET